MHWTIASVVAIGCLRFGHGWLAPLSRHKNSYAAQCAEPFVQMTICGWRKANYVTGWLKSKWTVTFPGRYGIKSLYLKPKENFLALKWKTLQPTNLYYNPTSTRNAVRRNMRYRIQSICTSFFPLFASTIKICIYSSFQCFLRLGELYPTVSHRIRQRTTSSVYRQTKKTEAHLDKPSKVNSPPTGY